MTQRHRTIFRVALGLLAVLLISPAAAQVGEQTLVLSNGWNAVWLEVEPVDTNGVALPPEAVFTDPAILSVASPRALAGLAEFFSDAPSNGTFRTINRAGWDQWHRTPELDEANTLPGVRGNRPYLVETSAAVSLPLQGKVRFFRPEWAPDRYNLVGFGLDPVNPPTFEQFFTPSDGRHPVAEADRAIFRLESGGAWVPIAPGDSMRSGEAYWVFCRGNSQYMGPVSVAFDGQPAGQLNFAGPLDSRKVGTGIDEMELDLEEIVFSNLGPAPASPGLLRFVNHAAADLFDDDLELYVVEPVISNLGYRVVARVDGLAGDLLAAALEETPGASANAILTLGAQRNWTAGPVDRINLYRLKTGAGSEFWLPIRAYHDDLQISGVLPPAGPSGGANPQLAGLWVGEVSVNRVTSIVEDGGPSRPAAGSAPIRILLHADTNGTVRLLSQVTLMQTRSADPEIVPESVLVLDPASIPFFEGIKQRRGKRVGVRLEAVTYDMPRKLDPVTQAALVSAVSHEQALADEVGILDYIVGRGLRPPSLVEAYHRSWELDGVLGAGQTVKTRADGPLNLDPFHRSNPFRHAFHQGHPRGPNITRELEVIIDAEAAVPGVLRGRYAETIRGLTKGALQLNGTVEMRRVSPVAILQGTE